MQKQKKKLEKEPISQDERTIGRNFCFYDTYPSERKHD